MVVAPTRGRNSEQFCIHSLMVKLLTSTQVLRVRFSLDAPFSENSDLHHLKFVICFGAYAITRNR